MVFKRLVRLAGLEPAAYGLEGRCSIQLSYKRVVRLKGVEPLTPRSEVWCSIQLSYKRKMQERGNKQKLKQNGVGDGA